MSELARTRPSHLDSAWQWLHRLVAVACLVFGTLYWVRLLGVYPGLLWRFDLMPLHWQVACVTLAVLYPFAAVGLWLLASWGPVIWFLCAGGETLMYGFMPGRFGTKDWLLVLHLAVALAYIVLRLLIYMRKRRAAL